MSATTKPKLLAHRSSEGMASRGNERWRLVAGALVAATAAALYVGALLTYTRHAMLNGFDLGVYRLGGLLAIHHPSQLYVLQLRPGYRFTYTPFAALLFAPLSTVPLNTLMNIAVLISVGALIATACIAAREMGLAGMTRLGITLLISGMAFWTEPVQRTLFFGQVDLLLMAVVVWDLCRPDARRWKGFATGVAAGIKLVPLIFVVYLLITRRYRQAAIATAGFLVTVLIGFAALPHASATWWFHGYFLQAGRTGFVGGLLNQSLRGLLARLAGSSSAGAALWLPTAVVVGVLGLAAAGRLHRAGRGFEGLMVCALTSLLISPISWDHHWVWIAAGLAVPVVASLRADRPSVKFAWGTAAVLLESAFFAWPRFWTRTPKLLHSGLLQYAPLTVFRRGHASSIAEYHWHGLQLVAGNLYVLVGCGILLLVLLHAGVAGAGGRSGRRREVRGTPLASGRRRPRSSMDRARAS